MWFKLQAFGEVAQQKSVFVLKTFTFPQPPPPLALPQPAFQPLSQHTHLQVQPGGRAQQAEESQSGRGRRQGEDAQQHVHPHQGLLVCSPAQPEDQQPGEEGSAPLPAPGERPQNTHGEPAPVPP